MKRWTWFVATSLTVSLTGFVFVHAHPGPAPHAPRAAARRVDLHGHDRTTDPLFSEAAARWRHGEPTHWRSCLLQQ
jgi:hypothetical protein